MTRHHSKRSEKTLECYGNDGLEAMVKCRVSVRTDYSRRFQGANLGCKRRNGAGSAESEPLPDLH